MRVKFAPLAEQHYAYWSKQDKRTLRKIGQLIEDILRDPYAGLGKPEPLKHDWQGYWSRRIDNQHRLIYRIHDDVIEIAQCRYHY